MRHALQSEVVLSYVIPLSLRDGVQRALTVTLADRYRGVGGQSQTGYNPGGLVPEKWLNLPPGCCSSSYWRCWSCHCASP
ncbi:MAG: Ca-activated chloride channel [Chloroflexota bacterium]|nr:Ca-activated chloride channel [Chloroflexota bacterium]